MRVLFRDSTRRPLTGTQGDSHTTHWSVDWKREEESTRARSYPSQPVPGKPSRRKPYRTSSSKNHDHGTTRPRGRRRRLATAGWRETRAPRSGTGDSRSNPPPPRVWPRETSSPNPAPKPPRENRLARSLRERTPAHARRSGLSLANDRPRHARGSFGPSPIYTRTATRRNRLCWSRRTARQRRRRGALRHPRACHERGRGGRRSPGGSGSLLPSTGTSRKPTARDRRHCWWGTPPPPARSRISCHGPNSGSTLTSDQRRRVGRAGSDTEPISGAR